MTVPGRTNRWSAGRVGWLVLLAGCASGAGGGATASRDPAVISIMTAGGENWEVNRGADVRLNQAITVTRDEAWAALPGVFEDLDIETDVVDVPTRRIGASQHRFGSRILNRDASDFFDCGMDPGLNAPLAGRMPINAQVITEVVAVGAGAELRTTVQGTARRSGGNAGVATCRSTGLMEVLVAQMVEKAAAPPG